MRLLPDTPHDLVNTVGHAAGVLTFGIFIVLAFKDRFGMPRQHRLAMCAAALALLWNGASLFGVLWEDATRWLAALGFAALSVLPAVLFHICLARRLPILVTAGYVCSAVAMAAHLLEPFGAAGMFHRTGLIVITSGFGALTTFAAVIILRSEREDARPLISRAVTAMLLFLFAISFIHFEDESSHHLWPAELLVHHAGIPLALFVILQDFRFVLLDALVRFVVSAALAGALGTSLVLWMPNRSSAAQALGATIAIGLFAVLKDQVQRLLSRALFRQPGEQRIQQEAAELQDARIPDAEYARFAVNKIAALMEASPIHIQTEVADLAGIRSPMLATDSAAFAPLLRSGVRVIVPLRLASGERHYGFLGGREGGRPYMSEDLNAIARLCAAANEHQERLRTAELQRLASEAELRALQAQINPHFLFNALNTLYGVVPREALVARKLVLDLADTFRYFLRSERSFVPLEEELRIVRAYLAIEEARLGTKLRTRIDVDNDVLRDMIPALSIQPLVENAVKHGAAAYRNGGTVRLEVRRDGQGLTVRVFDSGPGFGATAATKSSGTGVGLANVSRRLTLCYGQPEPLYIHSNEEGTCVGFTVTRNAA